MDVDGVTFQSVYTSTQLQGKPWLRRDNGLLFNGAMTGEREAGWKFCIAHYNVLVATNLLPQLRSEI